MKIHLSLRLSPYILILSSIQTLCIFSQYMLPIISHQCIIPVYLGVWNVQLAVIAIVSEKLPNAYKDFNIIPLRRELGKVHYWVWYTCTFSLHSQWQSNHYASDYLEIVLVYAPKRAFWLDTIWTIPLHERRTVYTIKKHMFQSGSLFFCFE